MKTYSTVRNTTFTAVLVATLAGLVTTGLAADQQFVYERDVLGGASASVLPEIVVVASRLDP